jgi:hypothetical protein
MPPQDPAEALDDLLRMPAAVEEHENVAGPDVRAGRANSGGNPQLVQDEIAKLRPAVEAFDVQPNPARHRSVNHPHARLQSLVPGKGNNTFNPDHCLRVMHLACQGGAYSRMGSWAGRTSSCVL